MNKPNWAILHNKFPPTQLRESDLYGRGRIAQLSFFLLRRSFFACSHGAVPPCLSAPTQRGGYSTNEVDRTNILAPGVCSDLCRNHLLPAFTPENFRGLAQWEVVSSYSSATAPDSHGISCTDPLFQARKELDREVAVCACRCKTFLSYPARVATNRRPSPLIDPSAASVASCSAKA